MTTTTTQSFDHQNFSPVTGVRASVRNVFGSLATVLLFGTLLFVSSAAPSAADMRGDQFVTMMDGNALSGTDAAGTPFNLYFLPGGQATYTSRAATVPGTWELDRDGDVCMHWQGHVGPMTGCFVAASEGDKVTWRPKSHHGETLATFLWRKPVESRRDPMMRHGEHKDHRNRF